MENHPSDFSTYIGSWVYDKVLWLVSINNEIFPLLVLSFPLPYFFFFLISSILSVTFLLIFIITVYNMAFRLVLAAGSMLFFRCRNDVQVPAWTYYPPPPSLWNLLWEISYHFYLDLSSVNASLVVIFKTFDVYNVSYLSWYFLFLSNTCLTSKLFWFFFLFGLNLIRYLVDGDIQWHSHLVENSMAGDGTRLNFFFSNFLGFYLWNT